MDLLLFYFFGAIAVLASLFVIGQRSPMYSVLLLIVSFGAIAGLYVLLDAEFVAVVQIIVYAGAIMVLFLFVVMLLNVSKEEARLAELASVRRGAVVLSVVLAVELLWALGAARGTSMPATEGTAGSVRVIGQTLFTEYAFAFEVTAILTLVAMLGAVVLTRRSARPREVRLDVETTRETDGSHA